MVQIPKKFKSYFDKEVILARGYNNRVYVYTPESFETLGKEIEKKEAKYGTKYPVFNKLIDKGIFILKISSKGQIELPEELLNYLGDVGNISFSSNQGWLEIYMDRPDMCNCTDPSCSKCILVGCKRDDCSTHSAQRKKFMMTRMKG